ncbi:phage tail spike protein [Bacillus changyiensis]|uniref:phage tail spike protein n=1 Tax=Bacillus changyiensis TaxID=3004103 RepID=UPI0022E717F4|nr:phage tail spike protein [Bacillus changyiensis]MDA1478356.1 phage tail protein [Bacillus changyiensis]
MADMWIFDNRDRKLTMLSSDAKEACRFYDAPFREELNIGSSFSFVVDADHEDSQYMKEENQVVFEDFKGRKRLFVIKELEEVDRDGIPSIRAICEPGIAELYEEFVTDIRPHDKTAQYAIDRVLEGTRWRGNVIAETGLNSTHFYRISAMEALNKILQVWGGEFYDEVVFSEEDDRIIDRVIHILPRRGEDTGKRAEIDKDIQEITRTVLSYPVTALYGYGASLETEAGGNSRYIDFSEIEWSVAKGDPVDKPEGQEWVGDPKLLETFGRLKTDGTLRHRFKKWQDDTIEDPAVLLQKTYETLINSESIQVNYSLKLELLEYIAGYEHEAVDLGDTMIAIDDNFQRPIEIQTRVIALEYDISDPKNTAQVEMGQFLDIHGPEKRLEEIEEKVRDIEQEKGNTIVTDDNFPDKKPPMPQQVEVKGLFSKVYVSWLYDSYTYIAAYEVYGSQVKGFTPDTTNFSNRLWRGKVGGFAHEVDVNQVWYYRIRAVNTHGTASDFTAEYSAATIRISSNHIEDASITNAKIKDLSADKLTAGTINGITIKGSLIQGGRFEPLSNTKDLYAYIEANTIYQKKNHLYFTFDVMELTASSFVQKRQHEDQNGVVLYDENRVLIENGTITVDGGKTYDDSKYTSSLKIYSQNQIDTEDAAGTYLDFYLNNQKTFSIKNTSSYYGKEGRKYETKLEGIKSRVLIKNQDNGWKSLQLMAPFVNKYGPFGSAQYRIDESGTIQLRGFIKKLGTNKSSTLNVAAIPRGLEPEYQEIFPAYVWSGTGKERIEVRPDTGFVLIRYAPSDGNEYEVSLSNISWRSKNPT